jgi:benzoylformate decarboxylase
VESHDELLGALDEVVPDLGAREDPLLVEVMVAPDPDFNP